MKSRTKKLTTLGMFCALAYGMVALIRIPLIPAVSFLTYEPKDVMIIFSGLIYGPLASFLVSVIVSFLEMITFSQTGPWGFLMNVLSSSSFACTAAFVYKKKRSLSGAVLGLAAGVVCVVSLMMLWNYLVTPIYTGFPREAVKDMLLPAFLPFNAIKSCLNASLTLLLYKPLVTGLRSARLLEPQSDSQSGRSHWNLGLALVALLLIASCVLLVLVFNGVL